MTTGEHLTWLQGQLEDYIHAMGQQGISPATLATYTQQSAKFVKWCKLRHHITNILMDNP